MLFLVVIIFLCHFLCSLIDILSMYRRYLKCWTVHFLHLDTCNHFSDRKHYASSGVFLFSSTFVEILSLTSLRMVPCILKDWLPRCGSLRCDFCHVVWLQVILSFSWNILKLFSFISACLMVSTYYYYYYYYYTLLRFYHTSDRECFSLEVKWQLISSRLQDSSQYSW